MSVLGILGIDFGFGYVKVASQGEWKVRTLLSEVPAGYEDEEAIEHEGKFYLVGEEASRFNPMTISSVERLIEVSPILLKRVLRREVEKPELIITGLPPSYYESHKESFKEALERVAKCRVEITRQGVGILFDVFDVDEDLKSALVLDVGFNTLDWLYVVKDKKKWRVLRYQTLPKMGVSAIVRAVKSRLEVSYPEVGKITLQEFPLSEGVLRLKGTEINFEEEKRNAIRNYVRNLIEELSYSLDDVLSRVDAVVVGGGGAYFLPEEELLIVHGRVLYPKEPYEFAQARGYRKIGGELL